ncbi:HNH endonuclease signature motif containing protein [Burkholderia multivorans]|uniref:HNH endonuclease signature motif containing protein n=1 Tax=Burkholderia multivorans TaxID=87883 RepID=UPI0021BFC9A0|nr:HNH endonuclease signature motif containing protein [Burkholderia multivorans]
MSLLERFHDKCMPEPMTGCWIWFGAHQPTGYGQLWNGERPEQAHRISYRLYCGPIPEGSEIDHRCKNPWCVNPNHLEAVTHAVNMHRSNTEMGRNARKTHCKRGHELTGNNLLIANNGSRQCRICTNWRAREAKRRKRLGRVFQ